MKYNITYACGHSGIEEFLGKEKQRESWIQWTELHKLCPICYEKKQEEIYVKEEPVRRKLYQMFNVCMLVGSEKNIKIAERIRYKVIKNFYIDPPRDLKIQKNMKELFENVDSAMFYIRHGYSNNIDEEYTRNKKFLSQRSYEKEMHYANHRLNPKKLTHSVVPLIDLHENYIELRSSYEQELITIVKSLRYHWHSEEQSWRFYTDRHSGSLDDRLCEICTVLLNNGYAVICEYENIASRIESKDWKEIVRRQILFNIDREAFEIWWLGSDDELYNKARMLNQSRWYKGSIYVPLYYYNEVMDFANIYDFRLSKSATGIIEYMKNEEFVLESEIIFTKEYVSNKLKEMLENRKDIPADLYDED